MKEREKGSEEKEENEIKKTKKAQTKWKKKARLKD